MTALVTERTTDYYGPYPVRRTIPMRAAAKVFKGGMVATDVAGLAMAAGLGAAGSVRVRGIAQATFDNSSGAASAIKCEVQTGVWAIPNHGTDTITQADVGNDCFVADDQTVARTSAGGTRIVAGRVEAIDGNYVRVQFDDDPVNAEQLSSQYKARNVVTSLQAYTGTTTATLTETANGAWATQDGVTNAVGDIVFIPATTTNLSSAVDSGPWQIADLGSASTKWVLKRPSWFAQGSGIVQGADIAIGGEGTAWAGNTWRSFAATGKLVGTDDPTFYPKFQLVTTAAMVAGVSAANSTLFVRSLARFSPIPVTPGGTQGILRMSTSTAGYPGTSSLVVTSSSNTDTSTVKIQVENF